MSDQEALLRFWSDRSDRAAIRTVVQAAHNLIVSDNPETQQLLRDALDELPDWIKREWLGESDD